MTQPPRSGSTLALLRWLGPWASDTARPDGISRESWTIRDGAARGLRAVDPGAPPPSGELTRLDAYVFTPPRPPKGLYVIAPGLHFAGPDDPRFDRFCRVLANAGYRVVAPFLPSYVDLRVSPSAVDDFEQVVLASIARFPELGPPTLFSISFGSFPALRVAARHPDAIDAVVTFGGYAEFDATVRFCVSGVMHRDGVATQLARDPLNHPALFLNIVRYLEVEGETAALERAWTTLCHRTWGRMELKAPGRLEPFVEALVPSVPAAQQELFRIGCGTRPGGLALLDQALTRGARELAYLNPADALARLACPAVFCHGTDDDVIPWNEAEKLHRAASSLAPRRLLLTGLFAHTGEGQKGPTAALREVRTLLAIVDTLASGGRLRARLPRVPG